MAQKNVAYPSVSMNTCFEKFENYAEKHDLTVDKSTYGFYEVRRADTKKSLEAVQAVDKNGTAGWIINWAGKERKFVANTDKTILVGKKVAQQECAKKRKPKRDTNSMRATAIETVL